MPPFYHLMLLLGYTTNRDESSSPLTGIAPAAGTPPAVLGSTMTCGEGVPLCGVLTLETGYGPGLYGHPTPSVHGLWPQVGHYGTSACIRPTRSSADPAKLYACYDVRHPQPLHDGWRGPCQTVPRICDWTFFMRAGGWWPGVAGAWV